METTRVNAVFEGGGVRGISLVGAVCAAERHNVVFNRVAGASSGSIVAALLAAGYTAAEMKAAIERTPISSLLKKSVFPAVRLFLRKGLYSGKWLELWIAELLEAKGVRTFSDLPDGTLRIIASDITNGRLLVLPGDIAQYGVAPELFSVARAVRMSTSIPYFFDPVILRQPFKERQKQAALSKFSYVVDGGLLSNFPLWLFQHDTSSDPAVPVIGFQMVGRSDAHPHRINGPVSMFQAIFETMLSAHDERYIEKNKAIRTIKIPTLGVGGTQFNLSPEKSEALYRSGLEAGEKFFQSWDRKLGMLKVTISKTK